MEIFVKSFEELDINELYEILRLRVDVFVVEQNCPYPEIDGIDKEAFHIFAKEDGEIVAYARIYKEDGEVHLGRVIAKERRKGYGNLILNEAIKAACQKYQAEKIIIEAQTYAKDFYAKAGFEQRSQTYMLDGIRHIKMVLDLDNKTKARLADNVLSEIPSKDGIKKLIDKTFEGEENPEPVDKAFEDIWDEINKEN